MRQCSCSVLCVAGKYAEALQAYQAAVSSTNSDTTAAAKLHSNIAITLSKLGQHDEAARAADEVIALQPAWEKGYLRKAHALASLLQYTEAMECIEQGLHRARDTAELEAAKQALQGVSDSPHKSKRAKHETAQQPASPLDAALSKLRSAGTHSSCTFCMSCRTWLCI